MSEEDTIHDDATEQTTEVGFVIAPSYRAMREARPAGANHGVPFKTTVNTLLLNGAANVYSDYIEPVLKGEVDHGSLVANEAVIGLKLIEHDRENDNLFQTCRHPRKKVGETESGKPVYENLPINALTVGRKVHELVKETYRLEKRSFVATDLLTHQN